MKRHSLLGCDIVAGRRACRSRRAGCATTTSASTAAATPTACAARTIPLESRIILVADAFEAMTSDRPYRKAPGQEFAIAELRRHAGTQFDPVVVDALCRVLDRPRPTCAAVAA